MPHVTVRLFAALRELAGSSHVDAQGATVGEVVEALSARFGDRFAGVAPLLANPCGVCGGTMTTLPASASTSAWPTVKVPIPSRTMKISS